MDQWSLSNPYAKKPTNHISVAYSTYVKGMITYKYIELKWSRLSNCHLNTTLSLSQNINFDE